MASCAELIARLKAPRLVRRVRSGRMTYLSYRKLNSLYRLVTQAFAVASEPRLVEFGVALGGSAGIMIHMVQRHNRGSFQGYDMFGMIPPPSRMDAADAHSRYETIVSGRAAGLRGDSYYGYDGDLRARVLRNLATLGVDTGRPDFALIEGDFRETFVAPPDPFHLMHIDCDWHDSVVFCLEQARRHMAGGGVVVIDDYHWYQGCRDAVDAFLARYPRDFTVQQPGPHFVLRCDRPMAAGPDPCATRPELVGSR
jgi:O-methyltransferase